MLTGAPGMNWKFMAVLLKIFFHNLAIIPSSSIKTNEMDLYLWHFKKLTIRIKCK